MKNTMHTPNWKIMMTHHMPGSKTMLTTSGVWKTWPAMKIPQKNELKFYMFFVIFCYLSRFSREKFNGSSGVSGLWRVSAVTVYHWFLISRGRAKCIWFANSVQRVITPSRESSRFANCFHSHFISFYAEFDYNVTQWAIKIQRSYLKQKLNLLKPSVYNVWFEHKLVTSWAPLW